jgi:hypothetical protein
VVSGHLCYHGSQLDPEDKTKHLESCQTRQEIRGSFTERTMNDLFFSESFPETSGSFGERTTNNLISPTHGLCMDSVQRLVIPASQSVEHDPVIEVAEIIPNVSEDFTIASCRLSGPGGGAARMAWSVTRSKRLKLFPLLAAMDLTRSKRSGPYRPRVR